MTVKKMSNAIGDPTMLETNVFFLTARTSMWHADREVNRKKHTLMHQDSGSKVVCTVSCMIKVIECY